MRREALLRVLAAVLATVLAVAALVGVGIVVLDGAVSAQAPDPCVPNGDPC